MVTYGRLISRGMLWKYAKCHIFQVEPILDSWPQHVIMPSWTSIIALLHGALISVLALLESQAHPS
jgi:hypothetical protein